MMEFPDARKVAQTLAALAEPTRLRILFHFAREPLNVGRLAELVGAPMVNMSHHLGVMRQAGLLEDEKDGRRVVYRFRAGVFESGDGDGILGTLTVGPYRVVLLAHGETPPNKPKPKAKRKPPAK